MMDIYMYLHRSSLIVRRMLVQRNRHHVEQKWRLEWTDFVRPIPIIPEGTGGDLSCRNHVRGEQIGSAIQAIYVNDHE